MGPGVGKTNVQYRHAMLRSAQPEGNGRSKACQSVLDRGCKHRSNRNGPKKRTLALVAFTGNKWVDYGRSGFRSRLGYI